MNETKKIKLFEWLRQSPKIIELLQVSCVYLVLAFINLRVKLWLTTHQWFDMPDKPGEITLLTQHPLLMQWIHTNNEQSRILQWMIPEGLMKLTGWGIPGAYMFQRWFFVMVAFVCFHFFLRKWFKGSSAFAAVCFLAAIMPLSYVNYLQESFSLLFLSFIVLLWLIREKKTWIYCGALLIAAMNNETVLILPSVFFFYNFSSWKIKPLAKLTALTLITCAPAYIWTVCIRYYTIVECKAVHLGGAWHLPKNIDGIWYWLRETPFEYWRAWHLYIFSIFGFVWIFAYLKFKDKPLFLRRASLMVPLFIICHMLTGRIEEVRQMLPLAFIIVPMGMLYLFPELKNELPEEVIHD